MRHSARSCAGFSLVETLIAAVLVAATIVSLAHLVAIAAEQVVVGRRVVSANTIAQSKLEHLRHLPWTYAVDGTRVSSAELTLSPSGALTQDAVGYVDEVDDFVRRWAIARLEAGDDDTLVFQVCVFARAGRTLASSRPVACVATIRTRQP